MDLDAAHILQRWFDCVAGKSVQIIISSARLLPGLVVEIHTRMGLTDAILKFMRRNLKPRESSDGLDRISDGRSGASLTN